MLLGWNTFLPVSFDIENFVWKTYEGEKGSIILIIFSCGCAFNVGGCGLVRLVLYTSLRLQFPRTYSLHTDYIYSTSNWRRIWNPAKHLRWSFFVEIVNVFKAVGYFHRRAPSCIFERMFDRILNATCPITYYSSKKV